MRLARLFGAAALVLATPTMAQDSAVTLDGNRLLLPAEIAFRPGTADFAANPAEALAPVKAFLESKSYISALRVEGHVASGADAQSLSERRALAVARRLAAMGVDCNRLIAVGFGAGKPVATPGAAANERVAFINAALRGRAIGGLPLDGGGKDAGTVCAP